MPKVTIDQEEYEELLETNALYSALIFAGVEQWSGFGASMDIFDEMNQDFKEPVVYTDNVVPLFSK